MDSASNSSKISRRNRFFIDLSATMPEEHSSTIPDEFEPQDHGTFCEFCGGIVKIKLYEHHVKRCNSNPINIHAPCPFCEKEFPSDLIMKHVEYCPLNPENIKSIHFHSDIQVQGKNIESHLKNNQKSIIDKSGEDCPICLGEIQKGDIVRFLSCLHKYHEKCIAVRTKQNKNCPVCRTAIP